MYNTGGKDMRKLLFVVVVIMMLTGCGNELEETIKKDSIENEDFVDQDVEQESKAEIILEEDGEDDELEVSKDVEIEEIEEIVEETSEEEDEEAPEETLSQRNAVSMAEDYLDYTSFSESGLIEQLEYEGFSNEDANYAINQITVDWQEQAVKMAEDYLDYTSFSRSGLIEQLKYEGFSNEHATYAVDQIGL